jgi:hypothetical protein
MNAFLVDNFNPLPAAGFFSFLTFFFLISGPSGGPWFICRLSRGFPSFYPVEFLNYIGFSPKLSRFRGEFIHSNAKRREGVV